MSQFSLSWDVQKHISNGLSSLQQNGEFVDMTLAADGHMVKVHQVMLALASPYIKELISSANCPHPVIFLNRVSYQTLCLLLEYIYMGEVLVSLENLDDLIVAGKELHIKGIEDMTIHQPNISITNTTTKAEQLTHDEEEEEEDEISYFQVEHTSDHEDNEQSPSQTMYDSRSQDRPNLSTPEQLEATTEYIQDEEEEESLVPEDNVKTESASPNNKLMQYTISNQGSVQMILNRFIYYVKHTNRFNMRQWRCTDYVNKGRCPAYVITKGDVVVKRIGAHTHPFHDKKILKKWKAGSIFSAVLDAELEGMSKKDKTKSEEAMEENADEV
ncbi:hypothetical protein JYU34_008968 [Plutella xylostella]|uniref:BTB domain-containing protein n=1 Tax=Plutella xylostella TaxID=51655 RepID=A0ABQ7QM87_PLUXY|nr:transcription factor GAGA [Plutella xylostella]KAG7306344.1 hypothetical protein JYU34_008968 [Plutella xylostella]